LDVHDTGTGMTPEVLAKIFDPFFTTKLNGRGLGLAVVEKILREHGAVTKVVSTPSGTTFQIQFPSIGMRPAVAGASPVDVAAEQSARKKNILLVDDEDILRFAIAKGLRKMGYEVLEASNGGDALEIVRSGAAIDILLLDLVLRGMSSREILEEVQHDRPGLKVILISAYSEQKAMASFGDLTTEQFLRKPFHLKDLIASLEKIRL
jgi:CheY-like chemotaxis protein